MAQNKQQDRQKRWNPQGLSKKQIKLYQEKLQELNLYDGRIDGIWQDKTHAADSTLKVLSDKGYTRSEIFRHTIGAPHMSDDEWADYIGGKRGFQKPKIEDTVIDTMKKKEY